MQSSIQQGLSVSVCVIFGPFLLRQGSKIEQLNAELSRKTTTISQLQAEIGAIRSDYDHLLDTVRLC